MVIGIKAEETTGQELESALKETSSDEAEGSPETDETTPKAEVEEGGKAETEKAKTPEELLEARVQAEADKRVNPYREKREADTALIRSLNAQIKELKVGSGSAKLTKAMQAVLAGDEEEGVEPDKSEAKKKGFDEIKASIEEYNQKATEVFEVAELATTLNQKLDKGIIKHFDLADDNPTIRAKGVISLISEATHFIQREEAFNKILDEIPLLQKGSEVRQQIDSFIERYLELPEGKGRDLLIEKLKQETRIEPRRKPPTPSGEPGGQDLSKLSSAELIELGLKEMNRKK